MLKNFRSVHIKCCLHHSAYSVSVLWMRISPIFSTNQCTTSWSKEFQSQETFHAHISQTIHSAHRNINFKIHCIWNMNLSFQIVIVMYADSIAQSIGSTCILNKFELKWKLWFENGITLEVLFCSDEMRRKHDLRFGMNYTAIDNTPESITNLFETNHIWLRNCCISGRKCPLKDCISYQKYALFVWIHCHWNPMICNSYRHSLGWINR